MADADRIRWFDYRVWGVSVGFCPSVAAWDRYVRKIGAAEPYPESDGRATWFSEQASVVVTVHHRAEQEPAVAVAALLVHEAVHAWQRILQHIEQSERPGNEIEAYAIQRIAQDLMQAYAETRVTSCLA